MSPMCCSGCLYFKTYCSKLCHPFYLTNTNTIVHHTRKTAVNSVAAKLCRSGFGILIIIIILSRQKKHSLRIRRSEFSERPLESRISRLILTLFAHGFVLPDRLNTPDRRPAPKSLRHSSLRSRFRTRASSMLQKERPIESRISWLILTLSSRGFLFPDRADTLDRRPGPKLLRRAGLSCRF